MATENMEILLKAEKKPEAEAIAKLVGEMNTEEQQEMLIFLQGMKFAKDFNKKTILPAAQTV